MSVPASPKQAAPRSLLTSSLIVLTLSAMLPPPSWARDTTSIGADRASRFEAVRSMRQRGRFGQPFASPFGDGQPQRTAPRSSSGTMTVPNR